jgi:Bacterial dnaA protein helix-turn-helix
MRDSTSQICGGPVLTAGRRTSTCRPGADLPRTSVAATAAGRTAGTNSACSPVPASQDIDALRARLLALAPPASPSRITVHRVLEVTAERFGTTVEALLSERRTQSLCRPRQIAMFVARKVTGRSLPFIGRRMGDCDHTTILHGWRAVQSLIDSGDAGTIVAIVQIIEWLIGKCADDRYQR